MKLLLSPEAGDDLKGIRKYISDELENPAAAKRTVAKIIKGIRGLVRFPDRGAPLSSVLEIRTDYRFLVCGKYLTFYRCEKNTVYVVRVLYGKRDYMKILFGDPPEIEEESDSTDI